MGSSDSSQALHTESGNKRRLLIIPYVVNDDATLADLVDAYWKDAVEQIRNLETRVGRATHLFHEGITAVDAASMGAVTLANPHGYKHLKSLADSGARFEPTEDGAHLAEAIDLHRCMSVVQSSDKVAGRLLGWFEESRCARYGAIAAKIDAAIEEAGVGVLVVSPDHDIKLAADIEVIYVIPPVLDRINIWMREHVSPPTHGGMVPISGDEMPNWARR